MTLKDVNDNKPIFEEMYYSAEVYETAKIGNYLLINKECISK